MLRHYIAEIAKEEFEIAEVFKKTVLEPNNTINSRSELLNGTILTDH